MKESVSVPRGKKTVAVTGSSSEWEGKGYIVDVHQSGKKLIVVNTVVDPEK